jgi:transposase
MKTCYSSRIFFRINELPHKFNLKSVQKQLIREEFNFWVAKELKWPLNSDNHKAENIIIPHQVRFDPAPGEILKIKLAASKIFQVFAEKSRTFRFGNSKKKHVQPVSNFFTNFEGFSIRKGGFKLFKKKLEKHQKKIKNENELIDLLMRGETDFAQLKLKLKLPLWKIQKMISAVCLPQPKRSKKIEKFLEKIKLLKTIESLTINANATFDNVKQLTAKLSRETNFEPISHSKLYRTLKAGGWKFRPVVFHSNETNNLKSARIWFFDQFLSILNDTREVVAYFDWSSFSEHNFQKKNWVQSGRRAVSNEVYVYAKVHLLAMISHQSVESVQFVRGNLSSQLIFDFLSQSIKKLLQNSPKRISRLTIVLDNSPMNHSKAIKNFCLTSKVKLLYTAPNSSFLNPIEQLFAKIKTPLKQAFTMNKYINQQRDDVSHR